MSDEPQVPAGAHAHGDPDPEISFSLIAKILLAVALVAIAFAIVAWPFVNRVLEERYETEAVRAEPIDVSRPPGPLLQPDPEGELIEMRRQEEAVLHSYGWADRSAGLARVPVERAAELVLERGVGPIQPPAGGAVAARGGAAPESEQQEQ